MLKFHIKHQYRSKLYDSVKASKEIIHFSSENKNYRFSLHFQAIKLNHSLSYKLQCSTKTVMHCIDNITHVNVQILTLWYVASWFILHFKILNAAAECNVTLHMHSAKALICNNIHLL